MKAFTQGEFSALTLTEVGSLLYGEKELEVSMYIHLY